MGIKLVEQMLGMCETLVDDAAALVGEMPGQVELEDLADRLSGLGGLTLDQMRERTVGTIVPGDFRHFRLTNLNKNIPWGGRFSLHQEPLEFEDLLRIASILARREDVTPSGPGVWIEAVALPIRDPGVLELGLRFAPVN